MLHAMHLEAVHDSASPWSRRYTRALANKQGSRLTAEECFSKSVNSEGRRKWKPRQTKSGRSRGVTVCVCVCYF